MSYSYNLVLRYYTETSISRIFLENSEKSVPGKLVDGVIKLSYFVNLQFDCSLHNTLYNTVYRDKL